MAPTVACLERDEMRHFPSLVLWSLLSSTATSVAVLAQEPVVLEEIIVSGAQEPREAGRTGPSVSVLSGAQIGATGETSLSEVLARLPGVGILARGPLGSQTGLTLRGVSQNYIKVLVDGIDVSDPSAPQVAYDFGRLIALGVDRLELLRGSQSAVHGGQAVAGVLSLSSALPDDIGTRNSLLLEAGSFNSAAASFRHTQRTENGAVGLTVSRVRTDGFSAADGTDEPDGYAATRLSMQAETRLQNGVKLGFTGFVERALGEYDPQYYADPSRSYSIMLGDGESYDELSRMHAGGMRVFAAFEAGGFEHEASAQTYRIARNLSGSEYFLDYDDDWAVIGATLRASDMDYTGQRSGLTWKSARDLGAGRLVLGADLTRESYAQAGDSGYGPESNGAASRTAGVFAEYGWAPQEGLDVVASLRHDDHSVFGGHGTGRLAATWALSEGLTLRGSLGTGFRPPSGYELFGPYGEAGLQPEQSRSLDFGAEKRFADGTGLRATLFRIEADNLIDFVGSQYSQISGTTRRQGLELEADGRLGAALGYTLAYTLTDASNPNLSFGNTWNAGFGRHQVALGLEAKLGQAARANLVLRHVAERPSLPDYTVVNAAVSYDISAETQAYLRVENLFDEDYQLWSGYGTSGRAVYVGLRTSF